MKKFALLFSAIALVFAFSVTSVDAQNVPGKKSTEKAISAKSATEAPAAQAKESKGDCAPGTDKAKTSAKSDCATPCADKAKSACCDKKASASAKPVPAPDTK
ncbi:MAG: hypothetical protein KUL83_01705 [Lentimicrobium sp.]|nr:hypothetical protein [Lentimicrobium sp.]MDD2527018.1 hypothetical protein [Lentimicrobiaceae bacterium]MDD4598541.1 hypothetical protein [Lentimicrobiaceae bacterium]MDY0027064.1 hypothetical protein [Lentimicrobium sp.]